MGVVDAFMCACDVGGVLLVFPLPSFFVLLLLSCFCWRMLIAVSVGVCLVIIGIVNATRYPQRQMSA